MYSGVSLTTTRGAAEHLNPNEMQGAVLRELYRTNNLLRPFRTADNIRENALWPTTLTDGGLPVERSYLPKALCQDNEVPPLLTIVRALRGLHDKGLILADKEFNQVALAEAGRVIIDELPTAERPKQAQLVVYGGFGDRD